MARLVPIALALLLAPFARGQEYDLVLNNGRVIDPETKLDAVRSVGITGGKIAAVSEKPLTGKKVIDATGLVIASGFIDLHAHGQSIPADRMQAFDGVTTALELESGVPVFADWLDKQKKDRRVLNYGAAAAWTFARVAALEGQKPQPTIEWAQSTYSLTKWVNSVASDAELKAILDTLDGDLKAGALGVGCNLGYSPGSGFKEMLAVHQLAAKHQFGTFTHIRNFSNVDPNSSVQAYAELLSHAVITGTPVHICHLNSTSARDISLAARVVRDAQKRGVKVTTEAYPYSAASTLIGAAQMSRDNLKRMGVTVADIEYKGTPLTDAGYDKLRKESPGEVIVFHYLRLPADQELLDESVLFPGGSIASDAMPWFDTQTSKPIEGDVWPLPKTAFAHPRSVATFTKFLAEYVRDRKQESLLDGIARCTLRPAQTLDGSVPAMKTKGRLQKGMDADVVVFDLDGLKMRSTFTEPNQHTVGVKHLIVNGVPVIVAGELDVKAFPGQPVRR
jgi:N-acyl-D-glutamate deacylase